MDFLKVTHFLYLNWIKNCEKTTIYKIANKYRLCIVLQTKNQEI